MYTLHSHFIQTVASGGTKPANKALKRVFKGGKFGDVVMFNVD